MTVDDRLGVPDPVAERIARRLLDVVLSGLGLLVLTPVMTALGLWVRLDSPGPALLRQQRVGRAGGRSRSTSSGRCAWAGTTSPTGG